MKKTLIALAAVAATGAAMAQSTVTLYGKANIGIQKQTGTSAALNGGADGSDSRWGLRGTEDLGGGLKANFLFESGFKTDTGALDNTPAAGAAAKLFQRQAWMGLSGGFGEVRLGRQYTLGFMGSIWSMPSTYVNSQLRAGLGFNGQGAREDDVIAYTTPKMGGVSATIATQLSGDTATRLTEVRVAYAAGPLNANLNIGDKKGTPGTTWAINAGYKMDMATLAAGYVKKAGDSDKGFFVHAGFNNMGAWTPYVQIARNTNYGGTDLNVTAYEFGTYYAMSKRTKLYALFGKENRLDQSRFALGIDHNF